jgi:hypothetical protein
MKKYLYILMAMLLITSCGIQKRKHLKGFYIPGKKSFKKEQSDQAKKSKNERTWRFKAEKDVQEIASTPQEKSEEGFVEKEVRTTNPTSSDGESYEPYSDVFDDNRNEIEENEASPSAEMASGSDEYIASEHPDVNPAILFMSISVVCLGVGGLLSTILPALVALIFMIAGIILLVKAFVRALQARRDIKANPEVYTGRRAANLVLWVCSILLALLLASAVYVFSIGFVGY